MNIPSILVVDDNDGDRLLAKLAIEDANITNKVFFSEDGKDALDFLLDYDNNKSKEADKFPPTIIFLDINMPRMNGFEFMEKYEELRNIDERFQSIVVMMLTSSINEKDVSRSNEFQSVKEWITKPLTEEKIYQVLAKLPENL